MTYIDGFETTFHLGTDRYPCGRISVRLRHDGPRRYYLLDSEGRCAHTAAVERYLREKGIPHEGELQRVYETKRGYIIIAHIVVAS